MAGLTGATRGGEPPLIRDPAMHLARIQKQLVHAVTTEYEELGSCSHGPLDLLEDLAALEAVAPDVPDAPQDFGAQLELIVVLTSIYTGLQNFHQLMDDGEFMVAAMSIGSMAAQLQTAAAQVSILAPTPAWHHASPWKHVIRLLQNAMSEGRAALRQCVSEVSAAACHFGHDREGRPEWTVTHRTSTVRQRYAETLTTGVDLLAAHDAIGTLPSFLHYTTARVIADFVQPVLAIPGLRLHIHRTKHAMALRWVLPPTVGSGASGGGGGGAGARATAFSAAGRADPRPLESSVMRLDPLFEFLLHWLAPPSVSDFRYLPSRPRWLRGVCLVDPPETDSGATTAAPALATATATATATVDPALLAGQGHVAAGVEDQECRERLEPDAHTWLTVFGTAWAAPFYDAFMQGMVLPLLPTDPVQLPRFVADVESLLRFETNLQRVGLLPCAEPAERRDASRVPDAWARGVGDGHRAPYFSPTPRSSPRASSAPHASRHPPAGPQGDPSVEPGSAWHGPFAAFRHHLFAHVTTKRRQSLLDAVHVLLQSDPGNVVAVLPATERNGLAVMTGADGGKGDSARPGDASHVLGERRPEGSSPRADSSTGVTSGRVEPTDSKAAGLEPASNQPCGTEPTGTEHQRSQKPGYGAWSGRGGKGGKGHHALHAHGMDARPLLQVETCKISTSVQLFVEFLYQMHHEAESLHTQGESESAVDMIRAVQDGLNYFITTSVQDRRHVSERHTSPQRLAAAALLRNDSRYIAQHLTTLGYQLNHVLQPKPAHGTTPLTPGDKAHGPAVARLPSFLPELTQLTQRGEAAWQAAWQAQRDVLARCLTESDRDAGDRADRGRGEADGGGDTAAAAAAASAADADADADADALAQALRACRRDVAALQLDARLRKARQQLVDACETVRGLLPPDVYVAVAGQWAGAVLRPLASALRAAQLSGAPRSVGGASASATGPSSAAATATEASPADSVTLDTVRFFLEPWVDVVQGLLRPGSAAPAPLPRATWSGGAGRGDAPPSAAVQPSVYPPSRYVPHWDDFVQALARIAPP